MSRSPPSRRARQEARTEAHHGARRGAALVAALALLALASALLAGAFLSAIAATRSARAVHGSVVAEGASRAALAECLASWGDRERALAVGETIVRAVRAADAGPNVAGVTEVRRLGAGHFIVSVDVTVGDSLAPTARRRMRVVVREPAGDSTQSRRRPALLGRWSLADLY